MSPENEEKSKKEYQAGKDAFERGEYRRSVQHLEEAIALSNPITSAGGEVQIWLVTAYEAAGMRTEAIALCKKLTRHPSLETRQQSKNLLYILEAPQLARRAEWLSEIPDLAALDEGESKFNQGGGIPKKSRPPKTLKEPEPIDLSQVNTKDNRFIWVALITIGLLLAALVWRNV